MLQPGTQNMGTMITNHITVSMIQVKTTSLPRVCNSFFMYYILPSYYSLNLNHTEKTVSLIYGQRINFFESMKGFLIQTNFLWPKVIDLLILKKIFLNHQNFLEFKETVFWVQSNFSLIESVFCPFTDSSVKYIFHC